MKNIKQFFTYMVVGALVMALSISCKSNEDPVGGGNGGYGSSGGGQSKSELVGDWIYKSPARTYSFKVDDNGNITFNIPGQIITEIVSYVGKINDTFDYPYTVDVVATYNKKTKKGTFKFTSASSCDTIYYLITDTAEFLNVASENTFTKN